MLFLSQQQDSAWGLLTFHSYFTSFRSHLIVDTWKHIIRKRKNPRLGGKEICGLNLGWNKQQNSTWSSHPGNGERLMGGRKWEWAVELYKKLGAIFNKFIFNVSVMDLIIKVAVCIWSCLTSKIVLVSNNSRRCKKFQMVSMTQDKRWSVSGALPRACSAGWLIPSSLSAPQLPGTCHCSQSQPFPLPCGLLPSRPSHLA